MSSYQSPPWTLVLTEYGLADIVPSGRPGMIVSGVPAPLARLLVDAANDYSLKISFEKLHDSESSITTEMRRLNLKEVK